MDTGPQPRPFSVRRMAVIVLFVVPLVIAAWVIVVLWSVAWEIYLVPGRLRRRVHRAETAIHGRHQ